MEAPHASTELGFTYTFPAIRGVQAGREYYVSMCPLKLLTKLFEFDNEELRPEQRAQRTLNKGRIPEIARYIVDNPSTYTFSAITASIDGDMNFSPMGQDTAAAFRLGTLTVSMYAKFIINDGQHRRAAIKAALEHAPTLGEETIAVVLFADRGLQRCQQMFSDLNRHAVRPSASLGILYDHRDAAAKVAKHLSLNSPTFRNLVETERSTLSRRAKKLFTLSALHFATLEFLPDKVVEDFEQTSRQCLDFWERVAAQLPEWRMVQENEISAGELRGNFIHSHSVTLSALARAGRAVYETHPKEVSRRIQRLKSVDWSRNNAEVWEGRAMIGGKMSNSSQSVTLICNELKRVMGLELTSDEQSVEVARQASHPVDRKKTTAPKIRDE